MDDKEVLKTFGFNLNIERLKRKFSQEDLAEKLNVSAVYVSNIESGKHNISLINALKFCNYFDLTVEAMLKQV